MISSGLPQKQLSPQWTLCWEGVKTVKEYVYLNQLEADHSTNASEHVPSDFRWPLWRALPCSEEPQAPLR